MWIMLDIEPSALPKLENDMKELGYKDFEITYRVHEGHRGATIQFGGELAGDGKPFDLVLLRVGDPSNKLFFIIRARHWPHDDERGPERDAYFYDEHTCPTNWTDDILYVIENGDTDPHGFATFVKRVPAPETMDENGYMRTSGNNNWCEEPDWKSLFPELFEIAKGTTP